MTGQDSGPAASDRGSGVKVSIDGVIHAPESASISVFDRGFLYGDSIYEVMRTAGGYPVDLQRHLARLRRSAATIALELPAGDAIERDIFATLAAAGNRESYLRVVVTRGSGEIGLDIALAEAPRAIVIVRPLSLPPEQAYRDGVPVTIVTIERTSPRALDPRVKSGNYLNNILALREARKAGAYEAIMCDAAGRIAEGSSSNLFAVTAGVVTTPALEIGLLAGITRRRVVELARSVGVEVVEGELRPDPVRGADEVFLTSSLRGILPVATVDGRRPRAAVPGPVTRRLMAAYREFLAGEARKGGSRPAR